MDLLVSAFNLLIDVRELVYHRNKEKTRVNSQVKLLLVHFVSCLLVVEMAVCTLTCVITAANF